VTQSIAIKQDSLGQEFEALAPAPRPGVLARMFRRRTPMRDPLPPGVRVYAVGDIHGHADLARRTLDYIAEDARTAPERKYLVFVGDYVDRGPDSRGVIELLMRGLPGIVTICLRGNHDQSMLTFLDDAEFLATWKGFGGNETLISYGVQPPEKNDAESLGRARDAFAAAIPPEHVAFVEGLPYFARIGDYLFVHAGFRPGRTLEKQRAADMLWIRSEFLNTRCDFGGTVVYGHTPSATPVLRPGRIGIDTGAYMSGNLTLAVLEGGERRFYAVSESGVTPWDV
jgi:serine/threonine protein phosphatase 1